MVHRISRALPNPPCLAGLQGREEPPGSFDAAAMDVGRLTWRQVCLAALAKTRKA
jgi:hypothetical protein